jgi:glycosyltransferase involved in cell wall biosynthesis
MYAPRVLQVLPALETGGVERATIDMVRALAPVSPATYVASAGGSLAGEISKAGGVHLELPLATKNPLQMLANGISLIRLIKQHGIQVIHARSRAPAWSSYLAARWTGISWVTTYHGVHNTGGFFKNLYNSIMTRGDRVIAISQFMADHITQNHKVDPTKIRLIHEGIDLDYFNPQVVSLHKAHDVRQRWLLPEDAKAILFPGRLTSWKGQKDFIEALSLLETPGVYGVICGSDQGRHAYRRELQAQVEQLGLARRVIFLHNQDDMRPLYLAADLVVTASHQAEAFGRVNAECAAMGSLLVATRLGATPEICLDEKTGFLADPRNPGDLAEKIDKALTLSAEDRERLIRAALEHVHRHFSLKKMCSATIAVYQELMTP